MVDRHVDRSYVDVNTLNRRRRNNKAQTGYQVKNINKYFSSITCIFFFVVMETSFLFDWFFFSIFLVSLFFLYSLMNEGIHPLLGGMC